MKHRTFLAFVLPSVLAMLLFIALPVGSVILQSVHAQHEQVIVEVENCGPFGCTPTTSVDQEATRALRDAQPLGRFNGLGTYFNRAHLATAEVSEAWRTSDSLGQFFAKVMNLPFYKALAFTLS